jgi:hypothetical protein
MKKQTGAVPPEKVLSDLLESVEDARAAQQVISALVNDRVKFTSSLIDAQDDEAGGRHIRLEHSKRLDSGIAAQYPKFFDVLYVGVQHMLVLGVARVFDTQDGKSNIGGFLVSVKDKLGEDGLKDFCRRLKHLREVAERVRHVRHDLTAHLANHRTADDVLTANNPYALISADYITKLTTFMNDLKGAVGFQSERVTTDERYWLSTRRLLHSLKHVRPEDMLPPERMGAPPCPQSGTKGRGSCG